ncbi:thioredoxin-like protein 1 [Sycon ciliatum]|uniref:thioredoxin-like protein 1 n=1 Tax=Sycon ciliatum TaxID=27933 RepID=UPI0031F70DC8
MGVQVVESPADFQAKVTAADSKLIVVDFFANWCGPCRQIAPAYEELSNQYPNVLFLKVNVDENEEVAALFSVSAMPTFIFMRSGARVGQVRGANRPALEAMLQQHASADASAAPAAAPAAGDGAAAAAAAPEKPTELLPGLIAGHIDLVEMVDKEKSECLNESDDHRFTTAMHSGGGYLQSECDEQLIIFITFLQSVKIHTLQVQSPDNGHAPKTLRLFTNLPNAPDFDSAETNKPTQEFVLKPGDTTGNGLVPVQFVKFQNVQSLCIFVKDNQGGEDTTIIDHFTFYGTTLAETSMNEFKRVSGKAGEVHGH